MRNMSFSLTTDQMYAGTKTVTRRLGWANLQPGEIVCAIEKGQGLKKGEKVKRIGYLMVINNTSEPLRLLLDEPDYGRAEVIREGFPDKTPAEFVEMFCRHNKCAPETMINRIAFMRVPVTQKQLLDMGARISAAMQLVVESLLKWWETAGPLFTAAVKLSDELHCPDCGAPESPATKDDAHALLYECGRGEVPCEDGNWQVLFLCQKDEPETCEHSFVSSCPENCN